MSREEAIIARERSAEFLAKATEIRRETLDIQDRLKALIESYVNVTSEG